MMVNDLAENRYSRQILFQAVGEDGQARINAARALIFGCGALGSVSAGLLARAGVGFLRIVDRDTVELSNLQRQALFDERDANERMPKAVAAARRLGEINSDITVEPVVADVGPGNISKFLDGIDIVVDGLDNFEARYLLNDACVKNDVPWVYGGCVGSYGLSCLIVPGKTPCLRCLFSEPPEIGVAPTCDTAGILGSASSVVASIQAGLALRWIVTRAVPADNALVSIDVWDNRYERLETARLPEGAKCPCCMERRFEFLDSPGTHTTTLCGRNSVQVCPDSASLPDFNSIVERLSSLGRVEANDYLLRFDSPPFELTLFRDGRVIVKGTTDHVTARSLVSRYLGV